MLRDAFRTFGSAYYSAPVSHNLSGGGHPLHSLVQVLVKRIAAIGRQHDIECRVHRLHSEPAGDRARGIMNCE